MRALLGMFCALTCAWAVQAQTSEVPPEVTRAIAQADRELDRIATLDERTERDARAFALLNDVLTPQLNNLELSDTATAELWKDAAIAVFYSHDVASVPLVSTIAMRTHPQYADDEVLRGVLTELRKINQLYKPDEAAALRAFAEQRWAEAQSGDINAMFDVGVCMEDGTGMMVDVAEAAKWYQRAADAGHVGASKRLGRLCLAGQGVVRSEARAKTLLEYAANQNDAEAMYLLGKLFLEKRQIAGGTTKAVQWLEAAANQNQYQAMFLLAQLHEQGTGFAKDDEAAADLYRTAAEGGNPSAMRALGILYREGRGVPRMDSLANDWRTKSINQQREVKDTEWSEVGFFGVEVPHDRVAFVCNVSNSMSGNKKMPKLRGELITMLDRLHADKMFSICLYNDQPVPLGGSTDWTQATPRNVRRAISQIMAVKPQGTSNPAFAIEHALSLRPAPEAIFFITDVSHSDKVANAIKEANTKTRVPIYTFTLGSNKAQKVMKKIANESGGTYKHVPAG
ncbi:MAG: SEL1-like repeat protein [Phycisphaeraceae bacterium]|nr:SEL1-like repeat protein [Phycisphaerales bacterium]MCB9861266.1 SEL1-like repeat protein [Phycisphaeraceae bacterium]